MPRAPTTNYKRSLSFYPLGKAPSNADADDTMEARITHMRKLLEEDTYGVTTFIEDNVLEPLLSAKRTLLLGIPVEHHFIYTLILDQFERSLLSVHRTIGMAEYVLDGKNHTNTQTGAASLAEAIFWCDYLPPPYCTDIKGLLVVLSEDVRPISVSIIKPPKQREWAERAQYDTYPLFAHQARAFSLRLIKGIMAHIDRGHRYDERILEEAVQHATSIGANVVEGYHRFTPHRYHQFICYSYASLKKLWSVMYAFPPTLRAAFVNDYRQLKREFVEFFDDAARFIQYIMMYDGRRHEIRHKRRKRRDDQA